MVKVSYRVDGDDILLAGKASSEFKRLLGRLGIDPSIVKRAVVAMYEGEMNMAIHAGGGVAEVDIDPGTIVIVLRDEGPGIPDLELAMREGWSTASDRVREMGFGAGMGLPNMKRSADLLDVRTAPGKGTCITLTIRLASPEAGDVR